MVPSLGRSDPIDHAEIAATKRSTCFLLPHLIRKGHPGIRVRRFVECILAEILLFPVARIGLRERIRVLAVVDYSRSLEEQLRPTLPSDRRIR
jgi:hypothetical protein